MSPKHGAPRATIVFNPPADRQVRKLELDPPALRAADRILVLISQNPSIGRPLGTSPVLQYKEEGVRVCYVTTALGSIVIVTYIEA